ncbi:hypothetical protein C4546_02785 [Candidatus Parcubacteria bacterium]|jgi:aromatic ring-opening dioxygenase catalytic subunit (LigB family)|nr:MAG: hypothetical protein C4546_02785 [Candidatus Parcubacteria bacterium]
MSIALAALVPHSPLLLPTTDEAHKKALRGLFFAYHQLSELLHARKVEEIICFNPHATSVGNVYTFNLARKLTATFTEFGDLTTRMEAPGSPTLAYRLKESLEAHWSVSAIIKEEVNYGSGIPILMLSNLPNKPKWNLISTREASLREHFSFGVNLQNELLNHRKRIAILASGDIATGVSSAAPNGEIPGAKAYYQDWLTVSSDIKRLKNFLFAQKPKTLKLFNACGAYSLSQLLGAVNSLNLSNHNLYADEPFGVGYQLAVWQPK